MFTLEWLGNFGFSVLRLSTPLIYAGLAAVISKKAGMMNMALEGMMLVAALAGVAFAGVTGNLWIGLVAAVIFGVATGAVIAFASISGKTDLYLTCIAINLAATGGTTFAMFLLTGEKATTSAAIKAYTIPSIVIPVIKDIPLIGNMISGHNLLTYVSFFSIFAVWFFLKKTRLGLRLRAVGENPTAASSVGISVQRIGYISFLISGVLCGLAGAFMSMGWVSFFMKGMINGRGYIGLSASNIANGDPVFTGIIGILFGFTDALATTLKSGSSFPTEFLDMIPYAATMIAVCVVGIIRTSRARKVAKGH